VTKDSTLNDVWIALKQMLDELNAMKMSICVLLVAVEGEIEQ
jgi:hypothetical protein